MAGDNAGARGDQARDIRVEHGARSVGPHLGAGPRLVAADDIGEFVTGVIKQLMGLVQSVVLAGDNACICAASVNKYTIFENVQSLYHTNRWIS